MFHYQYVSTLGKGEWESAPLVGDWDETIRALEVRKSLDVRVRKGDGTSLQGALLEDFQKWKQTKDGSPFPSIDPGKRLKPGDFVVLKRVVDYNRESGQPVDRRYQHQYKKIQFDETQDEEERIQMVNQHAWTSITGPQKCHTRAPRPPRICQVCNKKGHDEKVCRLNPDNVHTAPAGKPKSEFRVYNPDTDSGMLRYQFSNDSKVYVKKPIQ